jgi:hypothetical protein
MVLTELKKIEERAMKKYVRNLKKDTADLDLSHFKLLAALTDDAWKKLPKLKQLRTVKLPLSLQRIEWGTFYQSLELRYVNFASLTSLRSIGKHAFHGSGLAGDLNLPESLLVCESYAFSSCTYLSKIHLPDSLLRIEHEAFNNCKNLVCELFLPRHLNHLGDYAFYGCKELTGVLMIPSSLKSIGTRSFCECREFTSIDLHSSLESIGEGAFQNCAGLACELELPDSIDTIESYAFCGCRRLTGELRLPSSLLSIQEATFYQCKGFTSLDLPPTTLQIGIRAFDGCISLTGELKLPQSLRSIASRAFKDCIGFTGEVEFPPFLSSIADDAFDGCIGLVGLKEAIQKHRKIIKHWKKHCNVLMTISRVDSDYRLEVEEDGGTLYSTVSNAFFANFEPEGQLIYKALAFVDGEGKLGNGIARLIFAYWGGDDDKYLSNDHRVAHHIAD